MNNPTPAKNPGPPLFLWWAVWGGFFAGLGVIYAALRETGLPVPSAAELPEAARFAGVAPLLLSAAVRWLLLPRFTEAARAFPLFVIGAASAEGCALLGLMLGGDYRDELFLLGLLGVGQFVPFFVTRLFKPSGTDVMPRG